MKIYLSIFLALISSIQALDVTVETPDGNRVVMDVESYHQISDIQEEIELSLNFPIHQQTLLVKGNDDYNHHADKKEHGRNYDASVSTTEKSDIRYIIVTLADKSLPSLLKYKSSLIKAGDRINHVHPLRFLMCVFTDEELKVGMRNIHKRGGWVWSDFVGGLNESLQEEHQRNNLRDDQVADFARSIGVDSSEIYPKVRSKKWTDLVVHLINIVPRDSRASQYDL